MAGIVDRVRSSIYGSLFGIDNPVSTQWAYHKIVSELPENCTVLDIGCGDGVYFTNAKVIETIKEKNITITAIDIDAGAVEICKKRIAAAGLDSLVRAKAVSVLEVKETFDFVLWMESFPVIDPHLFQVIHSHNAPIHTFMT